MVKKKIKDERNFIPSVGPPQILQVLCMPLLILLPCTNLVVTGCSNILSSDFGCSHILTGRPALSSHSKEDQKLVFKTDYHLMHVKSIAECSKATICQ